MNADLDALVAAVRESAKYRHVCPDLIRRVGTRELASRHRLKDAVKETKNILHQIAGAYLDGRPRYDAMLADLRAAVGTPCASGEDDCASIASDCGSGESSCGGIEDDCGSVESDFAFVASFCEAIAGDCGVGESDCGDGEDDYDDQNHSPVLHNPAPEESNSPPTDHNRGLRELSMRLMQQHASTRERAPHLDTFYERLWAFTGRPSSVLDVACGLNPLALPWMNLPVNATYHACDLYADQSAFLDAWIRLLGHNGGAEVRDVITAPPPHAADVALVFKLLPLLEQWDKNAGRDLLRALNARVLVVSFPTRTLGGRGKGMADTYAAHFQSLLAAENWTATRLDFPNELVFVVRKG